MKTQQRKINNAEHNQQDIEFEFKNIKRRIAADESKLDYNKMSDDELGKLSQKTYNFKFMDTEADKQFLKQMMVQKLIMARNKSKSIHKRRAGGLRGGDYL